MSSSRKRNSNKKTPEDVQIPSRDAQADNGGYSPRLQKSAKAKAVHYLLSATIHTQLMIQLHSKTKDMSTFLEQIFFQIPKVFSFFIIHFLVENFFVESIFHF